MKSENPPARRSEGDSLTKRLVHLCHRRIDAADRSCAARLLLDWIGVATAGSMTRQGAAVRGALTGAGGPCHALAYGHAVVEQAAFINGSYGTLLEMDDLHRGSILHAGDVVIPAALAAGQVAECDGARLLDAMLMGYEVALRIGLAAAQGGYSAWYNSGTCGIFGAAMAAAHAAGLSVEQKYDALGHAGMQASGLWQCRLEPTDSKCLATAHAARAGVTAARFAAGGLRGARLILEGDLGFFPTLYPEAETSALCAERSGWTIHEVSLKPWPACRHVHPAIGAALHLRPDVPASAIDHVTVHSYAAGVAFCDKPCPETPHDARFSFQHAVAIALLRGAPGLRDFVDTAIADPEAARLRDRVSVTEALALTAAFPHHMGAAVDIALSDGTRLTHAADHAPGDPEMPMSDDAVHEKFRANLRAVGVDSDAAERLIRSVAAVKDAPSLEDLAQGLDAITSTIAPRTAEDFIQ